MLCKIGIHMCMKNLEKEFHLTREAKVQAKGESIACNNY
ncbi:hypothetical protein ICS_01001 [Bacillus cereus BAG2O-3]|nr:hypothetical protein ICS_01001 [Bacillus cereus BAG2O-3]